MSNKMALDALTAALDAMEHMANTLNNIDAVDEEEDAQHDAAFEAVRAAIAALQAEPQPKEGATDGLTPEQVRKVCAEVERLAAQSAPFKREDLTLAAVNCEHQIEADCVRLWRDETKEGTALSQLVDRVAAVVAQSAPLAQQAREYPPLPAPNMVSTMTGLAYFGDDQMRAYVDADRASSGATTQAVRMLTRDELNDVALSEQVGWGPGEYVEAIQRKFCEVNKLRIPADGVIGGV